MTEQSVHRVRAGRALLLLGLLVYFFALRRYSGMDLGTEWVDADSGQRSANAVRVLNGELPYRDFWAAYTPLPYFLNAGLFRVFGVQLSSFRLGLALVGACSAFLVYVITRRVASRTAASVACALCASWSVPSLNVNYGTWYCVPFALGTMWAVVRATQTPRPWPWLLAGLFAGVVLSVKVTYGTYVITAAGIAAIAQGGGSRGFRRQAATALLALAGAGSLTLIALHNRPTLASLLHFGLPLALCAAWAWQTTRAGAEGRGPWPALWLLAGGVAAAFLPWVLYFGVRWDAGAFLRHAFIGYANMGASVALPPASPSGRGLLLALGVGAGLVAHARLPSAAPHTRAGIVGLTLLFCLLGLAVPVQSSPDGARWLYTLVHSWVHVRSFLPLLAIWCALVVLWRGRGSATADQPFFAITVFATAVFLTYYPYSDVNHFQWAWPVQTILVCALVDRYVARDGRWARAWWLLPAGFAAVQWFELATHFVRPDPASGAWQARTFHYAAQPRGDVLVPAANAARVDAAVAFIRDFTAPGTPVLELYGHHLGFLADRPNPTYYDYFWPGFLDEAAQRDTIAALEARPPALVIGHRRDDADEPLARFTEYFPLLGDYLAVRYEPVQRIGPYVFYAARWPMPARPAEP